MNKLIKSSLTLALSASILAVPTVASFASAPADIDVNSHVSSKKFSNIDFASPLKVKSYKLTSYAGPRCAPVLGAGFYHGAIDLAATDGSPIYAMQSGVVDSYVMGSDSTTGTLRIDHGIVDGKRLITSYGHMWNPLKYVKVGDKVTKGQIISDIGSSGIANGSHLHLAVKWGNDWVDPLEFFNDQGLDIAKNSSQITAKKTASFCDSYTSSEMGLKKSASLTSETIAVLDKNTKVRVTPGVATNGYIKVTANGSTGWVKENVLSPTLTKNIALPKTTSTTKNVRYTPKSLQNIRSYPSVDNTKSGIVDTLKNGDFVTTTGRNIGDWYEMKYNDREVWVQKVAFMEAPEKVTSGTTSVVKGIDYTPKTKSNLYSYPSTSSLIHKEIVNVPNGSKLTGTGRALGNWTEVSHLGKTYWVTTAQLTGYELPKLSTIQKYKKYSLRVNQNFRSYPSTIKGQSSVIELLPKGEILETTGRKTSDGVYYEVKNKGRTGWINSTVINEVK